jgi:propanediol dehydratase small subunit
LSWDTSRLINRQIVKGSEDISTSTYSEAREGDGIIREWILKSKFKNLIVEVDKNTSTLTAEAGTTTTTINATGHGLAAGDYIVNRTRSNAVREILTAALNSFTVATVTGQVATDTISKFTAQVIGIEGIDDESACDYMYNYNEKSIRNASGEVTLLAGEFIVFKYNEVLTILVQRKENASVAALISKLGWSDGIVDGQPIVDKTIKTRTEALATANAELQKYANMVIKATFKTNQEGLKAGQMIKITDATTNRNIDQYFLIQKVIMVQKAELLNEYTVTAASALFGIEDFFQKVLKAGRKLDVNADAIIENVEDVYETCGVHDVWSSVVDPNIATATCGVNDSWTSLVTTPPFRWGVTVNNPIVWDFFTWG